MLQFKSNNLYKLINFLDPILRISPDLSLISSVLDNSDIPNPIISQKAIEIVKKISEIGLGSGFLYTGNSKWFNVVSDQHYSEIVTSTKQTYDLFINSHNLYLNEVPKFIFLGVGTSSEVGTILPFINNNSKISIVDVSTYSLLNVYSYLQAVGYKNIELYQADLLDVNQTDNSLLILKGGTSGNITNSDLHKLLSNDKGDLYLDYFLDKKNSNEDLLKSYNIKSVIDLAIDNYIRLFRCIGFKCLDSEIKANVSFLINEDDFGRNVVCNFEVPENLKEFLLEFQVFIPHTFELFHSYRRRVDFFDNLNEMYSRKFSKITKIYIPESCLEAIHFNR